MRHFLHILVACGFLFASGSFAQEQKAENVKLPPSLPQKITFKLPTPNRNLLSGNLSSYYQPTISKRPESGMYGYVRSTENGPNPSFFDIFHEGIDIQPVERTPKGDPVDNVSASADGVIVYTNDNARYSNYGRYIVIEHRCADFTIYTLYAHLSKITVSVGKTVKQGEVIGKMGYTGAGISRDRAHLHFEIDFLLNLDFAIWFKTQPDYNPRDPNWHGMFNGMNLVGVDPSPLLKSGELGTELSLQDILNNEKPVYTVRLPAGDDYFCWQRRFPALVEGGVTNTVNWETIKSWEVDFTMEGIPIHFKPSPVTCNQPELLKFDYLRSPQDSLTHGYIKRTGPQSAEITKQGFKWFSLMNYLPKTE